MYEKERQEVEIIMSSPDNSVPSNYYIKLIGYVEFHLHEIDGSQTILIRTKRRDSVEKFIDNEMIDSITLEQKARDLLERMEIPNAQNYSAGELVELANLFAG